MANRRRRLRLSLLDRDPHCRYCGEPLDERTASLDHWIPRSRGGTEAQANLHLACADCQRFKRNDQPDEFLRRLARTTRTVLDMLAVR